MFIVIWILVILGILVFAVPAAIKLVGLGKFAIAVIGFIFFIFLIRYVGDIKFLSYIPREIEDIKRSFEGRIVEKYTAHSKVLSVQTSAGAVHIYNVDSALFALAALGDSIRKIPNDDSVFLITSNTRIKLQYIWISESTNNSPLWPKEWKNKWRKAIE